MPTTDERPSVYSLELPAQLRTELSRLAEASQRTLAGEIRLALYRHVEREFQQRVAETKQ